MDENEDDLLANRARTYRGDWSELGSPDLPDGSTPYWEADAAADMVIAERDQARRENRDPDDEAQWGEGKFGDHLSDEQFLAAAEFAKHEREGTLGEIAKADEFRAFFKKSAELLRAGVTDPEVRDSYLFGGIDLGEAMTRSEALKMAEANGGADAEPEGAWIDSLSDEEFAVLMDPDRRESLRRPSLSASEFRNQVSRILAEDW